MVDSSSSIQNYLKSVVKPALLHFQPEKQYYLYFGNEAADADSIISALTWAYIGQYFSEQKGESTLHIPFVAVNSDEYQLRPETKMLLDSVGIDLQLIPSMSELASNSAFLQPLLANKSQCRFILLDHNLLSEKFQLLFENDPPTNIYQILDHHQDHHSYEQECFGSQRLVEFDSEKRQALVASTCTIVEEQFQRILSSPASSSISSKDSGEVKEIAQLLLGVILLDSLNMDPKAGKGTRRDYDALERLQLLLQWTTEQRNEFFQQLFSAKTSELFWSEVSFLNCLKFDYKLFLNELQTKRVGYSSVLTSIPQLLQKIPSASSSQSEQHSQQALSQLAHFYDQLEQLQLLVIMSYYQGKREILLLSRAIDTIQSLTSLLLQQEELQVSELSLSEETMRLLAERGFHGIGFHQGNVVYSRKQVAPIISKLLQ